jgi:hypothetical protein
MGEVSIVSLDLVKKVFQAQGTVSDGAVPALARRCVCHGATPQSALRPMFTGRINGYQKFQ